MRACGPAVTPVPAALVPPKLPALREAATSPPSLLPCHPAPRRRVRGRGKERRTRRDVRLGCCCGNNSLDPHPDPSSGAVLRAVSGSSLSPPPLPGTCGFGPPAGEFTPQSRLRGYGCRLFLQRQAPPGLKVELSSLCIAVGGKQAPHGGFKLFPAAEDPLSLFL